MMAEMQQPEEQPEEEQPEGADVNGQ